MPFRSTGKPWRPERLRKEKKKVSEEQIALRNTCRKVRFLLNKITKPNQYRIIHEFITYNVSSNAKHLHEVVVLVIEAAALCPMYSDLYAKLCKFQIDKDREKYEEHKSPFEEALLPSFETFYLDNKVDSDDDMDRFRQRAFGASVFLGYLYKHGVLGATYIKSSYAQLFDSTLPKTIDGMERLLCTKDIDECPIYWGLKLTEGVGGDLERSKDCSHDFWSQWIHNLEVVKPFCSNKIRFMIMDVADLWKNDWIPKRTDSPCPEVVKLNIDLHRNWSQPPSKIKFPSDGGNSISKPGFTSEDTQ